VTGNGLAVRWRPLRAGLRNVWEYDDQVIEFSDGRMILRGPNGSGKSNALALLFPFLIDGTMSAAAMDPFAGGRSMKSLLLGVVRDDDAVDRRFRHDQRLGYVWMEFEEGPATGERLPPEGSPVRRVTIGCGARANVQSDVRSWFFVTERRVGHDLDLAPGGEPLTRGALIETLGADAVFDTAEEYRGAVDRELYGLGVDRLGKLVGLIRVLRRPQLAGKLDLDLLSAVLSQGLPAIDPAVLDDVAASLDDLEAAQRELTDLAATRAVIDQFVPIYERYLRGEMARRATSVLDAERAHRRARRDLTEAQAAVERIRAELEANESARQGAATERQNVEQRRTAILESPAYRNAADLAGVEGELERARLRTEESKRLLDRADEDASTRSLAAAQRSDQARNAEQNADSMLTAVVDAADAVDAPWTLSAEDALDPEQLRRGIASMIQSRRDDVRAVSAALRDVEIAARDHEQAEQRSSAALLEADRAGDTAFELGTHLAELKAGLSEAVRAWCADVTWMGEVEAATLTASVDSVGEPGSPDLTDVYRRVVRPFREQLVADRRYEQIRLETIEASIEEARLERQAVAAESDAGPPPPPWREDPRRGRPGAPLWACCDFAEGLGDSERAALEAALDAAGLLDAWISPSGLAVTDPGDATPLDSFLVAVNPSPAERSAAPSLLDVLTSTPPVESALDEAVVGSVLGAIGLGTLGIAVSVDGRFTLGPLQGRAAKAAPEFIGASARAGRRRRRLAELDQVLDKLEIDRTMSLEVIESLTANLTAVDDRATELPSTDTVIEQAGAHREALARATLTRESADAAAAAEAELAAALAGARHRLDATAVERRLAGDRAFLGRAEVLLDRLDTAGVDAVTARRGALQAAERAVESAGLAEAATSHATERREQWLADDRQTQGLNERVQALRELLGADADEPLRALRDADETLRDLALVETELVEARSSLDQQAGGVANRVATAQGDVGEAVAQLRTQSARLVVLRRTDLLDFIDGEQRGADVGPDDREIPQDPTDFARWLSRVVGEPAPTPEARAQTQRALDQAQKQLIDELHQGYDAAVAHDDEIVFIEVTSERGVFPLARLAVELAAQQERLEHYLTDGDREVFERYLLNQVSHSLRRLLSDADEFVAGVNDALRGARTASGLRVELSWELAGDEPAIARAVRLLRHDTEQMGDDDRATLRGFFDGVIRDRRALDPSAGYRAALEAALDYRTWHVFRPVLLTASGTRTKLTRAKFRELSGGEQAVALHLPLFAAAAAHYARAEGNAPRLIALDEAFAGIDEAMRGELMGLTVKFDLDVIMTGHELWGAYAEVPSVAIHDLLRKPPAEGVSVMSLRWDGAGLVEA
jgi:uncharacterized protein (TIGR02680 family)